ncbi:EcsC family protein [Acinetobacter radioresistens]|uniref:EcsC family protein n=1 Tax=Acinetobacter radioresistens TaxID=40216 RepID=UPI003AFB4E50
MTNTNNNQSAGFISSAVKVAKKLSSTGLDMLNQATPGGATKQNGQTDQNQVIEGSARVKSPMEASPDDHPQHILRDYVPKMSRQLLGRHYNRFNGIANFIPPEVSNKISDYMFECLSELSSQLSSVEAILSEAGASKLEELEKDPKRSKRLSQALAEQNKWIASVQGAVSGATGIVGAAVDVPASLALALRTIYQTGRAHGFDLKEDQEIVQHVLRQIDMGLIAEKQAILMGLKAVSGMLQNNDVSQLQQLLGSSNDFEMLKKWIGQDGQRQDNPTVFSKLSILTKLTPLAGATVGAIYSWKLVEEASQKAQTAFAEARSYLEQHNDSSLSPLEAFNRSEKALEQASPTVSAKPEKIEQPEQVNLDKVKEVELKDHDTIAKVKVQKKPSEEEKKTETDIEQEVQQDIESLAEDMVEPHEAVEPQKTAVPLDEDNPVVDEEELVASNQAKLAAEEAIDKPVDQVKVETSDTTNSSTEAKEAVTKKSSSKK